MTINEFTIDFCRQNVELTQRKNSDYTGDKSIWYNFDQVEQYGVQPVHGFITRMVDKISRIETFLAGKKLKVADESGYDTLRDLANYAMLLSGYKQGAYNLVLHADQFYATVYQSLKTAIYESDRLDSIKRSLKNFAVEQSLINLTTIACQAVLLAYEANDFNRSEP